MNFHVIGSDRAGSLQTVEVKRKRKAPCERPFHDLTIAFNGYMYPCCQFYPDLPDSKKNSIGHFSEFDSIFSAFSSSKMVEWRLSLFDYGKKQGVCATCLEADSPWTDEQISERKLATKKFINQGIKVISYD